MFEYCTFVSKEYLTLKYRKVLIKIDKASCGKISSSQMYKTEREKKPRICIHRTQNSNHTFLFHYSVNSELFVTTPILHIHVIYIKNFTS